MINKFKAFHIVANKQYKTINLISYFQFVNILAQKNKGETFILNRPYINIMWTLVIICQKALITHAINCIDLAWFIYYKSMLIVLSEKKNTTSKEIEVRVPDIMLLKWVAHDVKLTNHTQNLTAMAV